MSVTLAATAAALFAIGTYLILQRALTRVIIGIAILSHGANILMMASHRRGVAPIVGRGGTSTFSDPLPQAFALTAIVISFGVTAFLLAMAYRSWVLTHDDVVQDDLEDRLIGRGGTPDKEVADEQAVHDEAMRERL
ncbi:MAG: sodium:proton antiporter [Ilumatobacteraceae bacterium]